MIRALIIASLTIAAAFAAPQARAGAFTFTAIEGDPMPLAGYQGGPVLVVNTASECGYTYQYEGLQALWEEYRERGLTVIAVPSDDFRQELATNAAVKEFCAVNYGLTLPMTEITRVRGDKAHPFYRWLKAEHGFAPSWNFNKVLIGPDGAFLASYPSGVRPRSPEMRRAIEAALR